MRRRRKRRRIYTNHQVSRINTEFKNTDLKSKQNVSTQTDLIINEVTNKDATLQSPQHVIINEKWKPVNIARCQIYLRRSCRPIVYRCFHSQLLKKNARSSGATRTPTLLRTIDGVTNIIVYLRNNTLITIGKLLLSGFISVGKLLDIFLELGFKVTRKVSRSSAEERPSKNDNNLKISTEIACLKQLIAGEFIKINKRLDCIEANQIDVQFLMETKTKAAADFNSAASVAPSTSVFVPPPPPPPMPPTAVPYKLTAARSTDTKKRSLSDISISGNKNIKNERITITVEDLRNVKLRSQARNELPQQKQRPFISEQMLNGVKLRPTSVSPIHFNKC